MKDEQEFKLIVNYRQDGNISSAMERPNLKFINLNMPTSGAHVFATSDYNHYDIFTSGAHHQKYQKNNPNMQFPFSISGALLILN